MAKKIILFVLVTILCGGAVGAVYYFDDHQAPIINVKETPVLACSIGMEDLMDYASANDDVNVKSFFIEENSVNDIADKGYLTYVAIDDVNNITKQRVDVDVDEELTTYHIELLQPLKAQINKSFKTEGYLATVNECGWTNKDTYSIEGVDYKNKGTYEVKITSKSHNADPLYTTVIVDDFNAPRIILKQTEIQEWTDMSYDDDYFLDLIDYVEDNTDNDEYLNDRVKVNWKEILTPSESGYVDKTGTYTITYQVTDSEGNTGKSNLKIELRRVSFN